MPLNPNIAMGYRSPRVQQADPQAEFAKGLQLKGLLSQQQAAEDARADDQAQRRAFTESGGDEAKYLKSLLQGGHVKAYGAVQEAAGKREKAKLDILKTGAEIKDKEAETTGRLTKIDADKLAQHNNLLANVASPEDGQAWVQMGVQSGAIKPEAAPMILQTFSRAQNPDQFRDVVNRLALGMKDYIEKNKPTYQTRNTGGSTDTISMPGLGGPVSVVNSVTNTQSPDNAASNARMAAEGAAGRAQADRHFNANKELQRERLEFDKSKPSASQYGKPPTDMRYTEDGTLEPIPGSKTDVKRKELVAKSQAFVSDANQRFDKIDMRLDRMLSSPALGGNKKSNLFDVATGMRGVVARRIPGSDATDFEGQKETILSNLGFKELADMRASSPTGGALGNITEKELTYLQASVASLAAAQSPEAMQQALKDIKADIARSRARINAAHQEDGGKGGAVAPPSAPTGKTIKRTGTQNGRKVIEYSDGSIEYAN